VSTAVRDHTRQFVKFAIVGGSGVVVNLAVFVVVLLAWELLAGRLHAGADVSHYVRAAIAKSTRAIPTAAIYLANACGFAVSVVSNYYLNRRWTFRSTGRVATEFPKFVAVSAFAYIGNVAVLTLCHSHFKLGAIVSQLIAIAAVMPFNYIVNKLWSFK
jgi:putative flippase GtrA